MSKSRRKKLISQREYARRRGISHVAVQRAVKAGRITAVNGKIDPARADREWRENTDQSKARNRITGRPRRARPEGGPSELMDLDAVGRSQGVAGYARARAARELYQARLTKLELDRQLGTLVRADEVRVAAFNAARSTRDQLMALPNRIAAILAGTQDIEEVRRILEEEIERTCQQISESEWK